MTPLLRFVVDSKPTGLKKRAELGIVTAEIPKNRAVGEDEGRVSLEELRAINWENINWSEFRDAISQNPGVGSSGFRRSIAQDVKFIQLRSLGILKTKTQQETLKSNKN